MASKEEKMEGPPQVTTKDPKKVAAGKKLAEYNRKKKEEALKEQESKKNEQESKSGTVNLTSNQCYGIGAFAVAGAIAIVGYQVWKSKKREVESFTHNPVKNDTMQKPQNLPKEFEME